MKIVARFALLLMLLAVAASPARTSEPPAAALRLSVERADDLDRLFDLRGDWQGGDIAASVPLRSGRVLWLFGDTWVPKRASGRADRAALVHNSIALQSSGGRIEFLTGMRGDRPEAYFRSGGSGWLWPLQGGIETSGALELFATRYERIPGGAPGFAFRATGQEILKVTNPDDNPTRWRFVSREEPFFTGTALGGTRAFEGPCLRAGGFIYVYGLDEDGRTHERHLLVARVREAALENFAAWEFFAAGAWVRDFRRASPGCGGLGAEFSVSYLPKLRRYALVTSEDGIGPGIVLRLGATSVGPWSEPIELYRPPESTWDATYFCYAAKAHPELARRGDELVISYVCNSTDLAKSARDARIYRPRFIRVRIE